MEERKEKIAKRIREIRGERTQKEFGELLGVTPMAVSLYETGDRLPSYEKMIKIAELGKSTVQDIFFTY